MRRDRSLQRAPAKDHADAVDPFPDEEGELELFVMEHAEQICTALEATDEAAKARCSGSDESEGPGAWSRRTSIMVRS